MNITRAQGEELSDDQLEGISGGLEERPGEAAISDVKEKQIVARWRRRGRYWLYKTISDARQIPHRIRAYW